MAAVLCVLLLLMCAKRSGGLLDEPRDGKAPGNVVMKGADAFGLPPREQPGSILRSQVCSPLASRGSIRHVTHHAVSLL